MKTILARIRPVLPSAAIVTAVLAGGAWQFTLPRMAQLRDLRARAQAVQSRLDLSPSSIDSVVTQVASTRTIARRVHAVRIVNNNAADLNALYDSLVELAAAAAIDVDRITPRQAEQGGTDLAVASFDIVGETSFAGLLALLDALDSLEAFHRVTAVHVVPRGTAGNPRLGITIGIEFARVQIDQCLIDRADDDQDSGIGRTEQKP